MTITDWLTIILGISLIGGFAYLYFLLWKIGNTSYNIRATKTIKKNNKSSFKVHRTKAKTNIEDMENIYNDKNEISTPSKEAYN